MNIFHHFLRNFLIAGFVLIVFVGTMSLIAGNNIKKVDLNKITNIIPTIQKRLQPTSIIYSTPPTSTPKPASSSNKSLYNCSPEAQAKINAYAEQIKNEYETCKNNSNAQMQQSNSKCKSDCDAFYKADIASCVNQASSNIFATPPLVDINACTNNANIKYGTCGASCLGLGLGDLNACNATYQEKQKNIFSLYGQYCVWNK